MEYGIFKEGSHFLLVALVNEKIKEGWKPLGGAFGHATYVDFYQSMVRDEKEQSIPDDPNSAFVGMPVNMVKKIYRELICFLEGLDEDDDELEILVKDIEEWAKINGIWENIKM